MALRTLTAVSIIAMMAVPAAAFQIDSRYIDNDGDLVADIPEDPSQWVDPATLIFAYTPVEDPAVYVEVWQEFLDHMSDVTGKPVQFFPVQSNAAQLEAMRAGRLHVAAFNTGSNPIAVACAGFRPFAMMAREDESFGYEMEIITYPDTPAFSGAHDNSILGVANRDYDAAAIANSVLTRMVERGVVSRDDLVTVYKSDTFPTSGYGTVYNLHPELQEKIQEAFFTFEWEGTALLAEFGAQGEDRFVPITFQEHWSVIRQIDAAMGVTYTCN